MKACAFCASQYAPRVRRLLTLPSPRYVVICHNCTARGPARESEALAIAAWDRRPLEDEARNQVSRTEAAYEDITTLMLGEDDHDNE